MSMEQNQLTRDLYAAGYTREDHPSFVYWSDWQNFGYLFEALLKFTWETPCGLLVDGKSDLGRGLACSDASFQGIDYCPENDNPLLRCPYEHKDCPHSIRGFPVPLCPCHTTGKRYSFEQSVEKVEIERSERQHRQYTEITGGVYCACVVGCNGYEGGRVEVKYDVEQCIRCRCQNPVCVIRKQKRDLSRANIFYDVRRTWITRIGFLEEKKVQTGYNLSSRNLIWDVRRIGLVVPHNGVNDGDHLPAGVAHGRHVGLPFISFFLKIKL